MVAACTHTSEVIHMHLISKSLQEGTDDGNMPSDEKLDHLQHVFR